MESAKDGRWVAARKGYLEPVTVLAVVFRGMFLGMLGQALPRQQVPHSVWSKPWVVYCKPAVQGSERVLQYLARYVHRIALANSRLVRIENGQVTFRYQVRKQRHWKTMTLAASEFIRRFLQHVLPRGTNKVRYYGFWNPSHRALLRQIQLVTGSGEPRAAIGRPGNNADGQDARSIVRDAEEVPVLRRRDPGPRRDHPPTHPSAAMTYISAPTHWLIRRPPPILLILAPDPRVTLPGPRRAPSKAPSCAANRRLSANHTRTTTPRRSQTTDSRRPS